MLWMLWIQFKQRHFLFFIDKMLVKSSLLPYKYMLVNLGWFYSLFCWSRKPLCSMVQYELLLCITCKLWDQRGSVWIWAFCFGVYFGPLVHGLVELFLTWQQGYIYDCSCLLSFMKFLSLVFFLFWSTNSLFSAFLSDILLWIFFNVNVHREWAQRLNVNAWIFYVTYFINLGI